ncbi:MAG: hypothetical protein HC822_19590 [Oscillochloris sp.]|nr:hypothetical protein [Oscillochloris sp.]
MNASGDLDISDSLVITGNGIDQTIIDGGGLDRVFDVFPSGPITFNLSNLTVQNGDVRTADISSGGGIYLFTDVTATVTNVRVRNNFAQARAGIEAQGPLTITDSEISNNQSIAPSKVDGGGLFVGNSLTANRISVLNNSVTGEGGGIHVNVSAGVTATITNSEISGNSATIVATEGGFGGGIGSTGNDGTINLTNVTISGNTVQSNGGGIYAISPTGGVINLTNVTIANNTANSNGGGIFRSSGTVSLRNTLVALNNAAVAPDINGTVSGNNNLVGNGAGLGGISNGVNGNLVGVTPQIGPLANNGGTTLTHALLSGSPAINAGSNVGCPAADQRGTARPQGPFCDIGAFELIPDSTPPDTTITANPPNPSNSANASFSFTGSDNLTSP